jgi:tyrosinase
MIGGDGWMSDPDKAALDPIFWLHHANIDRLWAAWTKGVPNEKWWLHQRPGAA